MSQLATFGEFLRTLRYFAKWLILSSVVGILAGWAAALFLVSLEWATHTRLAHAWVIWLLPLGGLSVAALYHVWGKDVEGGNNLILEEIHNPKHGVPLRMAPLILITTILTHLVGGSSGREGTAVQMGGSLASWLGRVVRLSAEDLRIILIAGISGGFAGVFGTPLAAIVFAMEVQARGRIRYEALVPCVIAGIVGDWSCVMWGIPHMHREIHADTTLTPTLVTAICAAAVLFGLAAMAFIELTEWVQHVCKKWITWPMLRPVLGGVLLLLLVLLVGTDYLGLGTPLIGKSFHSGGVESGAFAWKILFTAITLGTGFKGGEVTPLFCIGATLGCVFATFLGLPADLFAALGLAAVFAAAANTPLACVLMGVELYGGKMLLPLLIACVVAYQCSGTRSIYTTQREDIPKGDPHAQRGV